VKENGTLFIIPYPVQNEVCPIEFSSNTTDCHSSCSERILEHHKERSSKYEPKSFYQELLRRSSVHLEELEKPMILSRGSVVLLSSRVMHRSSPNLSDHMRRAYMPQFSAQPIRRKSHRPNDGTKSLFAFAVPMQ
jgi:ectoine hydroxylase-related dioxygenase (phytanoyl-CoA dioxygenase family)